MNRDRLLTVAIAGAIAVVLALGWFVGVSPVLSQAAAANDQRTSISASNQTSRESIVVLKQKYAGIDTLTQRLDGLTTSVPTDADIPLFLRELDSLSNQNSVGLTNVTVTDAAKYVAPAAPVVASGNAGAGGATPTPTPSASAGATPNAPVVPAGAAGRLVLIPVHIAVTGSYNNIMTFVGGLQSGPRLYLLSALAVTGTVSDLANYSGDLTGFVYALPLPEGVASLASNVTSSPSATSSPTPAP